MQKLLRTASVMKYTGFSRAQIYKLMDKGLFPRPIKIAPKTNAWTESDLNEWLEKRIAESRESEVAQ